MNELKKKKNPLGGGGAGRRWPAPGCPLLPEHLPPSCAELHGARLQVQMRGSATHHYYIIVLPALQRRGAGSARGGFSASARASLAIAALPQLLGAGETPKPSRKGLRDPPYKPAPPSAGSPPGSPWGSRPPEVTLPLPRGPPDGSLRSAASAPRRGARGCGRCIVPQLNN